MAAGSTASAPIYNPRVAGAGLGGPCPCAPSKSLSASTRAFRPAPTRLPHASNSRFVRAARSPLAGWLGCPRNRRRDAAEAGAGKGVLGLAAGMGGAAGGEEEEEVPDAFAAGPAVGGSAPPAPAAGTGQVV